MRDGGAGIAYTDNYFYAFYLNIDGQVIPFASVYLNSLESQEVVNQVKQEIENGRKEKRAKEYFDTAVERYERLNSQNNADNGNNSSVSNRGDNVRLGNHLLQKGRYYNRPDLYVKTQRADRFGITDEYTRDGEGAYTDDEISYENDPVSKVLGKPRGTKAQRREFAERERKRMRQAVDDVASALNTPIDVLESTEGLTGRRAKAKGWHEKNTGRIVVVLPNNKSVAEQSEWLGSIGLIYVIALQMLTLNTSALQMRMGRGVWG